MSPRPLTRTLLALAVAALCSSLTTSPAHATPGVSPPAVAASAGREDGRGTWAALWTSVRSALSALWPAGEPGPAVPSEAGVLDKASSVTEPWGSTEPSPEPTEDPSQPGAPQPAPAP